MKFQSLIMSAGNVLISIVVFVSTIYNHMYYYEGTKNIFYILLFLVVAANIILSAVNLKRNRTITIIDGIIAVLWLAVVVLGSSITINSDIKSNLFIIQVVIALISILAVVACFFVSKTKKATKLNAINIEVEKQEEELSGPGFGLDEAFKVNGIGNKEEAIGIASLLAKVIVPIVWGIFAIVLVMQIIEPGKIYANDRNILIEGLKAIEQYQPKPTYVYKTDDDSYQFLDENGTYLTKIAVEEMSNFDDNYTWKINYPDDTHTVEVFLVKQKDKVQVFNTEGKMFFEVDNRYSGEEYLTICYLMKQAAESGDIASTASIFFEENKSRALEPTQTTQAMSEEEYGFDKKINAYYKIEPIEEFKEFEDDENYKYLYFENKSFTENIIQIAITPEESEEVPFLEKYLQHKEKVFNVSEEHKNTIQEFYKNKKMYKLINVPAKASLEIDANDMFYDTFTIGEEEKEVIYAYKDGSIPFMNSEYNSYVMPDGRKFGTLPTKGDEASVFALVDEINIVATRIDTQLSIMYDAKKLLSEGVFVVNRHEGKKVIDLGVCYCLCPVDQVDTNQECIIQRKGYTNSSEGIAKSEFSQVNFVGPNTISLFNKNSNMYETYYYSKGDWLHIFTQKSNPKMYGIGVETALPGGYGPYDLIGIYDK